MEAKSDANRSKETIDGETLINNRSTAFASLSCDKNPLTRRNLNSADVEKRKIPNARFMERSGVRKNLPVTVTENYMCIFESTLQTRGSKFSRKHQICCL